MPHQESNSNQHAYSVSENDPYFGHKAHYPKQYYNHGSDMLYYNSKMMGKPKNNSSLKKKAKKNPYFTQSSALKRSYGQFMKSSDKK